MKTHQVAAQADMMTVLPLWVVKAPISDGAKTAFCWLQVMPSNPSFQQIADSMGVSKRTAFSYLKELRAIGAVEAIPNTTENGGTATNTYLLNMENPRRTT